MKTLLTSAALSLALAVSAFAQDAKPVIPPAAAPTTAPVQAPALKIEAPKATAPVAAPAAKIEAPKATAPAVAPKADAKAPAVAPKADAKADPKAAAKLVNLNTATEKELDVLPSIGKARSKAIIAGRPYNSVDDLLTKKVLPKDSFESIKGKVSVK